MFNFSWFFIRWPVTIFFLCFFIDLEILVVLSSFLFYHFRFGLKSVFNDYFYLMYFQFFLYILIRILLIEILIQLFCFML